MEYFSLFVIGLFFAIVIFYLVVKSKVGDMPRFSEDEMASKISSRERWIDWYHLQPEYKKTEKLKMKYFTKYVEMRELQLEGQKFTAIRKDIDISEEGRSSLKEYFPIAQKEIDLVKSGVDPEEARSIAFKGTRYENL
ncbi:hypothetical protein [Franzmannia qiaohouensis]|uniref:ATP synthase F0 subunit 8 n=1 Tax=Franzmannia qiaohouensis TaxID=1329370 RepID=A0ABU1HMR2_9GAMM|nr:hypothetical protein [Halomonas qiaohouensis]MDR5907845.1 hypothetical protein [Halomonas qiaohouensis]